MCVCLFQDSKDGLAAGALAAGLGTAALLSMLKSDDDDDSDDDGSYDSADLAALEALHDRQRDDLIALQEKQLQDVDALQKRHQDEAALAGSEEPSPDHLKELEELEGAHAAELDDLAAKHKQEQEDVVEGPQSLVAGDSEEGESGDVAGAPVLASSSSRPENDGARSVVGNDAPESPKDPSGVSSSSVPRQASGSRVVVDASGASPSEGQGDEKVQGSDADGAEVCVRCC